MSEVRSPSPEARLVAVDSNATQCGAEVIEPSSDGFAESPFAWRPPAPTLTRLTAPPRWLRTSPARPRGRCQTKTSRASFVSPPARLVALEWNAASRVLRLSPDSVTPPASPLGGLLEPPTEIG